jgi:hypothetical protein
MAKTSYQTFTQEAPLSIFRSDFIRRDAMCGAMVKQFPDLGAIAAECAAIVAAMDARSTELRAAEDALTRARALEDAEKLSVVGAYARARTVLGVEDKDAALLILPDAPSSLRKRNVVDFNLRVRSTIESLGELPADHPVRVAYLPPLQAEFAEFSTADVAEDEARARLGRLRLSLTLYRAELAQERDGQLGRIQGVVKDRAVTAMFTIPWRKRTKAEGGDADETEEPETPTATDPTR